MSEVLEVTVDATAEARLKERERLRKHQQDLDLHGVMESTVGRRVIWRILDEIAGVARQSFTGDDAETNFREGARAVGLKLTEQLFRVCPTEYVHMLTEELAARQEEQLHRDDAARTQAKDTERNE